MRRLTRVRKLLRSVTVQVNIGDKQVNVAGDNAVVDGGQGQPAVSRRVLIGSWQRTVNYFTVGRESSGGALAGPRIHDEVRGPPSLPECRSTSRSPRSALLGALRARGPA